MMTGISSEIKKDKNRIVAQISPERDMLNAWAAELSNRKERNLMKMLWTNLMHI